MNILEDFTRLGLRASYHLASDNNKDWVEGFAAKQEAEDLYIANPAQRAEMREIARQFLWHLDVDKLEQ